MYSHTYTALEALGFPGYCIPTEDALRHLKSIFEAKFTGHTNPYTGRNVTTVSQSRWAQRALKKPTDFLSTERPLVSLSGWPDDRMGLLFTAAFAARAFDKGMRVRCIDIGNPEEHTNSQTHVVVLHNLITEASPERIQKTRDLLVRYRKYPRFLVMSGFAEPLYLFKDRIRMCPDASLLFDGWTHETLNTYVAGGKR